MSDHGWPIKSDDWCANLFTRRLTCPLTCPTLRLLNYVYAYEHNTQVQWYKQRVQLIILLRIIWINCRAHSMNHPIKCVSMRAPHSPASSIQYPVSSNLHFFCPQSLTPQTRSPDSLRCSWPVLLAFTCVTHSARIAASESQSPKPNSKPNQHRNQIYLDSAWRSVGNPSFETGFACQWSEGTGGRFTNKTNQTKWNSFGFRRLAFALNTKSHGPEH